MSIYSKQIEGDFVKPDCDLNSDLMAIYAGFVVVAKTINEVCPSGRQTSLALTKLAESWQWVQLAGLNNS